MGTVNIELVSGDLPKTAAKKAPARSYDYQPTGDGSGVLVTSVGRLVTGYRCAEFPCQFDGRAFALVKLFGGSDPESAEYHAFVARNGQDHSCTCKGFTYAGHCSHHDALSELIRRGAFDPAA